MKKLLCEGWSFCKFPLETPMETIFSHESWEQVDIPHDWMIYDSKNLYEEAISCYKLNIDKSSLPLEDYDNVRVIFDGVYMDTTIYLNGEEIFKWKHGYSQFVVDLTDHLTDGINTLMVRNEYHLPNSRWYPGSGIYRNVWLELKKSPQFAHNGTYISTKQLGKTWEVFIDAEYFLGKCSASKDNTNIPAIIRNTIIDHAGNDVTSGENNVNITPEIQIDKQVFTVIDPLLWDTENPNLYQIITELEVDGQVVDSITQNLGFRTIEFDADKGLFLNGNPLKIQGTCEHHVLGSLGAAMNKTALKRQFEILKKMGVNSIRNAHNMPPEETLDLCDKMGILLDTEAFDMWEKPKTDYDYAKDFPEWWKRDLESWVRQDRNHPCVFIWSIGNEIYDTCFDRGLEVTKMLHDAVRSLDYRQNAFTTLSSNNMDSEGSRKCAEIVDLVGYNYLDKFYDEHHKEHKDWIIYGSETASTLQSRGIYHFPLSNRLLTFDDNQCSALGNCTTNWGAPNSEHTIKAHRDRDYCFGQYIWTGFDYIGEPTPYYTKNSYFGQVDTAGFPKDSFYMYQSAWTNYKDNPMIHILPYWDFNKSQLIDVRVYSNAPVVELFLNGNSLGKQQINHVDGDNLSGNWQLSYEPGTLHAIAYDEEGHIIADEEKYSFGDPARIKLTPDKTQLIADGSDLIFLTIETIDKDGHIVENARNRMNVSVTGCGRLIGLDNGDSTDMDQYKGTSRRLFSGKLLAIIAAKDISGDINVKVTSPDLPSESLTLKALPGQMPEGMSCIMENKPYPIGDRENEIPIRKIELINRGPNELNKDCNSTVVEAKIWPENASYSDLIFKAVTLNGTTSNSVVIDADPKTNVATITAIGDGDFRLCCQACNGLDHVEVISELEFSVTGLGSAYSNPYELISGIDYSSSSDDNLILSFKGGIYITSNKRTTVTFEGIDFGRYGSDKIHLPIFSFEDEVPVEVWAEEECLVKDTYRAKSWYNHYQENIFNLSKRLKGLHDITIVVTPSVKMSLQGFYFEKIRRETALLLGSDADTVSGDAYVIDGDYIREIGNNVTIEFKDMHFKSGEVSKARIAGFSHNEINTFYLRFSPSDGSGDVISNTIQYPHTDGDTELEFDIENLEGDYDINIIFLPGCKFDFKSLLLY
ncbi:MAG: DUF4982 domain-containing protein [Eubacterium sp.]|nr:DUF4982 domain-containing protein [Eubacterium sp.]